MKCFYVLLAVSFLAVSFQNCGKFQVQNWEGANQNEISGTPLSLCMSLTASQNWVDLPASVWFLGVSYVNQVGVKITKKYNDSIYFFNNGSGKNSTIYISDCGVSWTVVKLDLAEDSLIAAGDITEAGDLVVVTERKYDSYPYNSVIKNIMTKSKNSPTWETINVDSSLSTNMVGVNAIQARGPKWLLSILRKDGASPTYISEDRGRTWNLVDEFIPGGVYSTQLTGTIFTSRGTILVYGYKSTSEKKFLPFLRRLNGANLDEVLHYNTTEGYEHEILDVSESENGSLFALVSTGVDNARVFLSEDDGINWSQISHLNIQETAFTSIAASKDQVFICGYKTSSPRKAVYFKYNKNTGNFDFDKVFSDDERCAHIFRMEKNVFITLGLDVFTALGNTKFQRYIKY